MHAVATLQLDQNDPIENLRAILEAETGLPSEQQRLVHNGRELSGGCAAGRGLGGWFSGSSGAVGGSGGQAGGVSASTPPRYLPLPLSAGRRWGPWGCRQTTC